MVTTSHSAPYGFGSPSKATALAMDWINNTNIHIISPQLYTKGDEPSNDWEYTTGTSSPTWSDWNKSKAILLPSIMTKDIYPNTKSRLSNSKGYVLWRQLKPWMGNRTWKCTGIDWACANDADCGQHKPCSIHGVILQLGVILQREGLIINVV